MWSIFSFLAKVSSINVQLHYYFVIHEYKQNDVLSLAIKYCHHVNLCRAIIAMYSFNATKVPKKTASFAVSFRLELFGRTVNTEFPPTIWPGTMRLSVHSSCTFLSYKS